MKRAATTVLMLVLVSFATTPTAGAEEEKAISLDEVPKKVMEAVKKAVPGIKITEAEVEEPRSGRVYEIHGIADGKAYEVEVSAEGNVLEIEEEGDDAEDDDGKEEEENDDGD